MGVTSKVNRAYAKEWRHDYVKYTGIMKGNEYWHATFNKAYLLQSLLAAEGNPSSKQKKQKNKLPSYDLVMMLDADSLISDLNYNVLDMFPEGRFIGINGIDSGHMKGGVVFFNLRHPDIWEFSKEWANRVKNSAGGEMALAAVLQSYGDKDVHTIEASLADSFAGTVIKFFRKPPLRTGRKIDWLREDTALVIAALEQTMTALCYQFYPKCELV
eukprot:CAMPEP_0183310544 /NCGR_PEP_ID=MMETSP0160_2-20130417/31986_1 /TAXON_ID=2839 ORGANISM="Odontella Sinensis, Strain Grunow 1884" /NCGR_SAMPLE_ID=MMETSP0160_2 /ASSEMBLY_ACC=CAM_ASM_000250 /LENGTH=214 /DNA_ID=CAMNT_0025474827 /DNA_START=392 /DNA_END=1036 /DNA_ORIENTATION=-